MVGLRPLGLEFRILCMEDNAISFISPPLDAYLAQLSLYVHKGGLKPNSFHLNTHYIPHNCVLTVVLLNCFKCIFRHLKLALLTQFPSSNDE